MNKKIHITYNYVAFILLLIFTTQVAGQKIQNGPVSVTPYELRQEEDSLYMDINIDFSNLILESNRSLTLTPILASKDYSYKFQPVLINGKTRHKLYERQLSVDKNSIEEPMLAIMLTNTSRTQQVRYQLVLPFEEWMADAHLDLRQELCGCAGKEEHISVSELFAKVELASKESYQMELRSTYIKPPVEAVKSRSEQQEAFLDFPVAKTNILPNFGNNPIELAKIEKMIATIREDKNITVNRVNITGYASPEGSQVSNMRLSAGRAEALKNYLSSRAGFPSSIYWVEQGGEDWNGLLNIVSNSYISYKDEIISIIKFTSNPEERKNRLKRLGGGVPYRQMLNEMYPKLRRVVSRVEFTVRGFNAEEAREIVKTSPQQLSLEEMFMAANTYTTGSTEFVAVFETAVRMYPDDPVANLNAAAAALTTGNYPFAENYLQKADKTTPEYKNNTALLHMMRGEYDHARSLLEEAAAGGAAAARHNLEELRKKEETENSRTKRKQK